MRGWATGFVWVRAWTCARLEPCRSFPRANVRRIIRPRVDSIGGGGAPDGLFSGCSVSAGVSVI